MLFPTIDFAVFFALVFPVTWLLNRLNFSKKVWLVAASYAFYSFWSAWLLGLLFFSATLNFLIGLCLGPIDGRGVARALVEFAATVVGSMAAVSLVVWAFNDWAFVASTWATVAQILVEIVTNARFLVFLAIACVLSLLIGVFPGPVVKLLGAFVASILVVVAVLWASRQFAFEHATLAVVAQSILDGFVHFASNVWLLVALVVACVAASLIGILVRRHDTSWRKRSILTFAVLGNLSLLGFYKYYNFFSATLSNLFSGVDFGSVEVALPIAISFLTFHGLSYVIDVYRGRIGPSTSIVDLLLYISFFPHLVAGPIVRAHDFLPQLRHRCDPAEIDIGYSVFLILGGLFKKVVIASHLSTLFVDRVFALPSACSSLELILGMYGYAIVIYCDFSAYTDIAIGIANLLGYKFPQNFNQPYRALSLQDFWRRWHITLSTWLRDYLYISLGGNRHGTLATYRNLILTMTLGGLWHGAGLQFMVWGLMHGLWLALERLVGWPRHDGKMSLPSAILAWFVTFHFVCIAWIFFRSPSLDVAWSYLTSIVTNVSTSQPAPDPSQVPVLNWLVVSCMILGFATQWISPDFVRRLQRGFELTPLAVKIAVPFATIFAIAVLAPAGIPPFIYFQF